MKISSATLFPHLNSPAQFSCFGTEQGHHAQNLATHAPLLNSLNSSEGLVFNYSENKLLILKEI